MLSYVSIITSCSHPSNKYIRVAILLAQPYSYAINHLCLSDEHLVSHTDSNNHFTEIPYFLGNKITRTQLEYGCLTDQQTQYEIKIRVAI